MKTALAISIPAGAIFTLFAWSLSRLSSDAVALALGMTLGVLWFPVTLWVVSLGARRDAEDDWQPTIIEYPARPAVTYANQVTPHTHLARRALSLPPLPTRSEIADMRLYLDAVEAGEVTR